MSLENKPNINVGETTYCPVCKNRAYHRVNETYYKCLNRNCGYDTNIVMGLGGRFDHLTTENKENRWSLRQK